MMISKVFHIQDKKSEITVNIFPPLRVSKNAVIGLTHFQVYNSIPNIDERNNEFTYFKDGKLYTNILETGTYELSDIEFYIKNYLGVKVKISANRTTLKCTFWCENDVDFSSPKSIGTLMGFTGLYKARSNLKSKEVVAISKVGSIGIDVNIVEGSYVNGVPSNCLYKCYINTPPGYRIEEIPKNVIYLPVTTQEIDTLHVRLLDDKGELINFRGEEISLELHLYYDRDSIFENE